MQLEKAVSFGRHASLLQLTQHRIILFYLRKFPELLHTDSKFEQAKCVLFAHVNQSEFIKVSILE